MIRVKILFCICKYSWFFVLNIVKESKKLTFYLLYLKVNLNIIIIKFYYHFRFSILYDNTILNFLPFLNFYFLTPFNYFLIYLNVSADIYCSGSDRYLPLIHMLQLRYMSDNIRSYIRQLTTYGDMIVAINNSTFQFLFI